MLLTFDGDAATKRQYIDYAASLKNQVGESEKHNGREKLFWSQRRWCQGSTCQIGLGCDHRFYADEIGVTVALAYSERALFLELPARTARRWSSDFLQTLPVGVDLDAAGVWKKLALYVLADRQHGVITFAHDRQQKDMIERVIALFHQDSCDLQAWREAAYEGVLAYAKTPYNNHRMEADEALLHAGCWACYVAADFARCFEDPRCAAQAISGAAWCATYKRYSQYMASQPNPEDDVRKGKNGKVSLADSLLACGQWVANSNEGDRLGVIARNKQYLRIANLYLRLLRASAGGNRFTRLRQLLGSLPRLIAAT